MQRRTIKVIESPGRFTLEEAEEALRALYRDRAASRRRVAAKLKKPEGEKIVKKVDTSKAAAKTVTARRPSRANKRAE